MSSPLNALECNDVLLKTSRFGETPLIVDFDAILSEAMLSIS